MTASFRFFVMLVVCVSSPVSAVPSWLQVFSWMLPPTYVFEGMRALLIEKAFRADLMTQAFALNAVLFAAGVIGFLILLKNARREGTLLQGGD